MRIIAGAARGRRLRVPADGTLRPTSDRAKEALFSSLMPLLPDATVLDLYAGTGALGLEALSRSAAKVTFVERSRAAIDALRHNIEVVGLAGTQVVAGEVGRALAGVLPSAPFDLVFIDPPYDLDGAEVDRVLTALVPHLADRATVIVERDVRAPEPTWPETFEVQRPRRYGSTLLYRGEHGRRADEPSQPPDRSGA